MIRPTQDQLNEWLDKSLNDSNIYPYLTLVKYFGPETLFTSDWDGIQLITRDLSCLLKITFSRVSDLEFKIGLFATNSFVAGRAIFKIIDLINMYKPRAINSFVHSSNEKSLKLHKRFYGEPWGVKKEGAWNMKKGAYEDLMYFRKIL